MSKPQSVQIAELREELSVVQENLHNQGIILETLLDMLKIQKNLIKDLPVLNIILCIPRQRDYVL